LAFLFKLFGAIMAKPSKQKISLQDSDWDQLFPSKSFTIASTSIQVAPLSLEEISKVLNKLSSLADSLSDLNLGDGDGIAESGLSKEAGISVLSLVSTIMERSPDILSDISGLDEEDVKGLPLGTAVELFNFCLEVNISSQESLIKNLSKLGDQMARFTGNSQQKVTPRATIPLADSSNS